MVSPDSVLLRIETDDYVKRGVGVRWLSAFPGPTQSVGSRSIVARERSDNSLALADRARAERTERLADRVPQPPARPPRPLPRAPAGRRRTVR